MVMFSLIPFFVVLFISVCASIVASKRGTDFYLADRSLSWPMLFGTLIGTQLGGGFIVGNADSAWQQGIWGALYGVGLAIGLIFLGISYGRRLSRFGVSTLSELLEKKYGTPLLKQVAGLISVLSLGGILMSLAIGCKKFLLSLGFSGEWVFFFCWGVVIFYTTYGGLLAVVWTDLLQALVMIAMLVTIFYSTFLPNWIEIVQEARSLSNSFNAKALISLIIPMAFVFVEQDMAQRCFAAKSAKDITIGALLTSFFLVVLTVVPLAAGLLGRKIGVFPEQGSVFVQVLQLLSSPFLFAVGSSAVLLAIVSTASSVLLAVSSNIAKDITKINGSLITAIVGGISLFGPLLGDDVVSMMVSTYEISVFTLLIPLLAAVYSQKKNLPQEAAWGSILFGAVASLCLFQMECEYLRIALLFGFSILGFTIGLYKGQNRVLTRRVVRERV